MSTRHLKRMLTEAAALAEAVAEAEAALDESIVGAAGASSCGDSALEAPAGADDDAAGDADEVAGEDVDDNGDSESYLLDASVMDALAGGDTSTIAGAGTDRCAETNGVDTGAIAADLARMLAEVDNAIQDARSFRTQPVAAPVDDDDEEDTGASAGVFITNARSDDAHAESEDDTDPVLRALHTERRALEAAADRGQYIPRAVVPDMSRLRAVRRSSELPAVVGDLVQATSVDEQTTAAHIARLQADLAVLAARGSFTEGSVLNSQLLQELLAEQAQWQQMENDLTAFSSDIDSVLGQLDALELGGEPAREQ